MARPDDGIVRQFHQAPDGSTQSRAVAAGQVGAAAVADKQGVARKQVALGIEADAARGVSGRVEYIESYLTQWPDIISDYQNVRPGVSIGIERMDDDFRSGQSLQLCIAGRVVAVTVGVDDVDDFKIFLISYGQNPFNIRAGIDHHCLAAIFAAHDIAEIVHVSGFELFDDHHYSPYY